MKKKIKDLHASNVFEQAILESTNRTDATKYLQNTTVDVDADHVYYNNANFKTAWKDIRECEWNDVDGTMQFLDIKKNRYVKCYGAQQSGQPWTKFLKLVQVFWQRQLNRVKRRQEREVAANAKPKRTYTKPKPRHRTYAKFSSSYTSNNAWSDDDDDEDKDDILGHSYRDQKKKTTVTPQGKNDDHDDEESDLDQESNNNNDNVDQYESEPEPEMEDELPVKETAEDMTSDVDDDDTPPTRDTHHILNSSNTKTPKPRLQERRKRLRKLVDATMVDSDDSDSENEFGFNDSVATMTTPTMNQNVVTPRETKILDSDDEQEQENVAVEKTTDEKSPGTKAAIVKTKPISDFFKAKSGVNKVKPKPSVTTNKSKDESASNSNNVKIVAKISPKPSSPTRRGTQKGNWLSNRESLPMHPAFSPKRSPKASGGDVFSPPRTALKQKPSGYNFFTVGNELEDDPIEDHSQDTILPIKNQLKFSPSRSPHRAAIKRRRLGEVRKTYVGGKNDLFRGKSSPINTNITTTAVNTFPIATKEPEVPPCSFARGLYNMGNTCYLNSSLQMIYTIQGFVSKLKGRGGDLVKNVVETASHVADISSGTGAASAKPVKNAIDKQSDNFQGFEQRDAHEFLGELIDKIHDELAGQTPYADGDEKKEDVPAAAGDSMAEESKVVSPTKTGESASNEVLPTDEYFRCDIEVSLKCKSCGYTRSKQEMYRHLSLDIVQERNGEEGMKASIEKSLEQFFQEEEREIKCEKCEDGKAASQKLRLLSRYVIMHDVLFFCLYYSRDISILIVRIVCLHLLSITTQSQGSAIAFEAFYSQYEWHLSEEQGSRSAFERIVDG